MPTLVWLPRKPSAPSPSMTHQRRPQSGALEVLGLPKRGAATAVPSNHKPKLSDCSPKIGCAAPTTHLRSPPTEPFTRSDSLILALRARQRSPGRGSGSVPPDKSTVQTLELGRGDNLNLTIIETAGGRHSLSSGRQCMDRTAPNGGSDGAGLPERGGGQRPPPSKPDPRPSKRGRRHSPRQDQPPRNVSFAGYLMFQERRGTFRFGSLQRCSVSLGTVVLCWTG